MDKEALELKLYEDIKKSFSVEKGQMLMVEWDIAELSQVRTFLSEDLVAIRKKVSRCVIEHYPFAVFDYLNQAEVNYTFRGLIFKKVEVIRTGEILDFHYFGDQAPVNVEEIKKEFEKLKRMLNSKAS